MINIEREAVAHHEAGHVVLYDLLDLRVESVTIERDNERHPGSTEFMTRESVKRGWRHEAECISTCSGCIAEQRFTGRAARGFAGDEPMLREFRLSRSVLSPFDEASGRDAPASGIAEEGNFEDSSRRRQRDTRPPSKNTLNRLTRNSSGARTSEGVIRSRSGSCA